MITKAQKEEIEKNLLKPFETQNLKQIVPLKIVVKLDPIQLGIFYKENKTSNKKKMYLVDLSNLFFIGDSEKITDLIYSQHSQIFNRKWVPYTQVCNIINKMIEYIQNEFLKDNKEGNMAYLQDRHITDDLSENYMKNFSQDNYLESEEDPQSELKRRTVRKPDEK